MAFLKQEYKFLTIFMVSFAAIIVVLIDDTHTPDIREGIYTAIAFLFGGAISIASGIGPAARPGALSAISASRGLMVVMMQDLQEYCKPCSKWLQEDRNAHTLAMSPVRWRNTFE